MRDTGKIYILRNPAFANDCYKIGMTRREVKDRINELSRFTGIPARFEVVYETAVANCVFAENVIHKKLENYRFEKDREFFTINLDIAIEIIESVVKTINDLAAEAPIDSTYKAIDEEQSSPPVVKDKDDILISGDSEDSSNAVQVSEQRDSTVHFERGPKPIDEIHIKTVSRQSISCVSCKYSFKVTLSRYENLGKCPSCGRMNEVNIEW